MNRHSTALAPAALAVAPLVAGPSSAGPEKIAFPANWASYTLYTSAPGTYDYICGLHPSMKGQVEVK